VQNPFGEGLVGRLNVSGEAICTSGDYRRFVEIKGRKYSHIVDPRTGLPVAGSPSVTVIAPLAVRADALATALSVLGPKEGIKLIESMPEVEAMMIEGPPEEPKVHKSSGFDKYVIELDVLR
jgi:thiamine biosynthesis lipoprotein